MSVCPLHLTFSDSLLSSSSAQLHFAVVVLVVLIVVFPCKVKRSAFPILRSSQLFMNRPHTHSKETTIQVVRKWWKAENRDPPCFGWAIYCCHRVSSNLRTQPFSPIAFSPCSGNGGSCYPSDEKPLWVPRAGDIDRARELALRLWRGKSGRNCQFIFRRHRRVEYVELIQHPTLTYTILTISSSTGSRDISPAPGLQIQSSPSTPTNRQTNLERDLLIYSMIPWRIRSCALAARHIHGVAHSKTSAFPRHSTDSNHKLMESQIWNFRQILSTWIVLQV